MKKDNTREEEDCITKTLELFTQLQNARSIHASTWEEIANLIWPETRNTFFYGSLNWPGGAKKTDRQVDATGMMANQRFAAICDSLLTPANQTWHTLGTSNPYLNKNRNVRLWFEQATNLLFAHRYAPHAAFMGNNHANYLSLGSFGTMAMMVDELDDPIHHVRGLRYKAIPLGELFLYTDHQNQVIGFIRWFKLTARQAYTWLGEKNFPEALEPNLEHNSEMLFDFIHHCGFRGDEWEPDRIDWKGKPFCSDYISMTGRTMVKRGGYRSFPIAVGRYVQGPNEVYGRSPALMVLPALKTLNLQKRTFLKAGHRAADPVLLVNDDSLLDGFDLRPGAINKGGVTADGRPLVHTLPVGDVQIAKEQMEEERQLINDSFLITLFQILTETPTMTATEVLSRVAEKSILLSPTIGRQGAEYLGSMIDRELDILSYLKLLPPMPKELVEAHGEYTVTYTSPLAKSARAAEASGFMRTIETAIQVVNSTQDPSHLDMFNFDAAFSAIADIQNVPESWLADDKMIAQKRASRAQAQKRQEAIQAAPAQAAMMKARMDAMKNNPNSVNEPGAGDAALGVASQGRPQFGPAG